MHNRKRQLPPLGPLIAFEAAARHQSFSRAATELSLSQAAVSQQIKVLEENLGTRLFERSHRAVRLSLAGQEFQHTVTSVLNELAGSVAGMRQSPTTGSLTIAADQSIAALWLMPRLASFTTRFPSLSLRLLASDNDSDCLAEGVDVAIIHGEGQWPGFHATQLFPEEIFAVCSPQWLSTKGQGRDVHGWLGADLLELEDEHWNWMHWRTWLARYGVTHSGDPAAMTINSYPLLLDAARRGRGIALGWRYLVDEDLATGRLIKAAPFSVVTGLGYYLVWRSDQNAKRHSEAFRQWAVDEIGSA